MTIPSRVLGAGAAQLMTVAICGDGSDGLTAAGSTQSDALQLVKVYNNVSTASAGTGVKLPKTQEGEVIYVSNSSSNPIKVYPYEAASTISGTSYVWLPKNWAAEFCATTLTTWHCVKGTDAPGYVFYYGSFYDTTTQSAASINTAYGMTLNTTAEANGVSIGSPTSRVVVENAGVYNIQFSLQLDKVSAAVGNVYIWLRLSGVDVAQSTGKIALQGSTAETVAAWNYVITLAANDYIELMWSTDDTNCQIIANGSTPPAPAIPSVILTVVQES